MYVITHLGGAYKVLLQYGHSMRKRHGPEFKRNIRFDDAELSLCIDVRLPGKEKWITISHGHVLADRRASTRAVEISNVELLSSRPALGLEEEQAAGQLSLLPSQGPLSLGEGVRPGTAGKERSGSMTAQSKLTKRKTVPISFTVSATSGNGGVPMDEGLWGSNK